MKPIKLWAIIDIQKKESRLCYAHPNKDKGIMALYDKKPIIDKDWKDKKKVIRVIVIKYYTKLS